MMDIAILKSEPTIDEVFENFENMFDEVARTEVYLDNLYRSMGYIRPKKFRGTTKYGASYKLGHERNKWSNHMRIYLNHLPDPMLSPNKRLHWREKQKHASLAKEEAMLRAIKSGRPMSPYEKAHITITVVSKDKRKRDVDNLFSAMKSYIDGIGRAGVIKDDSADRVSYTIKYENGKEHNTIIDIEKIKEKGKDER